MLAHDIFKKSFCDILKFQHRYLFLSSALKKNKLRGVLEKRWTDHGCSVHYNTLFISEYHTDILYN